MEVRTIYTRIWFRYLLRLIFRDFARSLAFGFLVLLGIACLLGSFFLFNWLDRPPAAGINFQPANEMIIDGYGNSIPINLSAGMIGFLFLGIPLAGLCWWAALEIVDDRHWDNSLDEIWENRHAHSIANTLNFANQLRARGMEVDTSMLMAEDIYSEAHRLIESTDENTLRLYMAAILAARNKQTNYSYRNPADQRFLPQRPALQKKPINIKSEDSQ